MTVGFNRDLKPKTEKLTTTTNYPPKHLKAHPIK